MKFFGKKYEEGDPSSPDLPAQAGATKGRGNERKRSKPRKEINKPWGKKERYLVGSIFIFTSLLGGLLALSARSWKAPGLPRFSLPDFSLEETYILDGPSKRRDEKTARIVKEFQEITNDLSGVYGFKVIRLNKGIEYGVNEREEFQAASLIKLPVMAMIISKSEDGELNLNLKYTLKDEDKIGGSGSLQYEEAGSVFTYEELLRLMGQKSDNTAFGVYKKLFGEDEIQDYINEIGMRNTSLAGNATTINDVASFYEKLWKGKIVSTDGRDTILENLTDTIYEDHLAAGVSDPIAHKYGREVRVVNDAGIVLADNPFIVVIMTKGVIEKEADEIFPELVRLIYEFESSL